VKVCFVDTPNTQIELIEPLGESSPIHGFLAKNPAGGQHHLLLRGARHPRSQSVVRGKGARLLGEPRIGAHGTPIFFVHPKDMGGVLTEIMETPNGTDIERRTRSSTERSRRRRGRDPAQPPRSAERRDADMLDEIKAALADLDGARAVLLLGAGRAFCSGAT
jgi:methylmalonyl-CoA epimerase